MPFDFYIETHIKPHLYGIEKKYCVSIGYCYINFHSFKMSKVKEAVNLKHKVKLRNLMRYDVILFRKSFIT